MKIMTEVGLMDCVTVGGKEFECRVCGVQCDIAPQLPERPVCSEHCEDHDYRYERGEGHRCIHCFAAPPQDWFDE
jgi:endogenous inhibitor of DNA gyrase (YacG/DUF329 family)